MHIFHKWKYVYKYLGTEYFEGIKIPRFERMYRVCTKCGKTQKRFVDFYGQNSWYDLCRIRKNVLMRQLVDKGDHYYLPRQVKKKK